MRISEPRDESESESESGSESGSGSGSGRGGNIDARWDDAAKARVRAEAGNVTFAVVRLPKVETYRVKAPQPTVRVETVRFVDLNHLSAAPLMEPKPNTVDAGKSRQPVPSSKKAPPKLAPNVPMRDRLLSVLQPPISTLLGDNRVWLPFEPFPYQYEGIQFLYGRWGAIIGDEMGLGKTMQTIMALRLLLRAGMARTVLLVCPKPLVTNWLREFRMWAEEIPITEVRGDTWTRRNCWLHDRSPVKLVNYESLTRDAEILDEGNVQFDLVVLDEAQRIKNHDSRTARVARGLKRHRSWALTGTPVENHARDLVSLLEFVYNGDKVPMDRSDMLRDAVGEVLLRRTKEMVMNDMPPRLVRDVYIDLTAKQRESYDAVEKDGIYRLNDIGDAVTIEHVFDLVRRLKQICNFDQVSKESAKAEQLRADLEEIAASGKKALVFSQWVTTLEWLAKSMSAFHPLLYHGKFSTKQRDEILKRFREDDNCPVLMLSYATGAVGLNLQFTNYVFLFDRWWNPAIEDQAINRAHRIGQKEPVFVSRFVSPNTIEERIGQVLEDKRALFASLIENHDPATVGLLTREEIFGLFDLKVRLKHDPRK